MICGTPISEKDIADCYLPANIRRTTWFYGESKKDTVDGKNEKEILKEIVDGINVCLWIYKLMNMILFMIERNFGGRGGNFLFTLIIIQNFKSKNRMIYKLESNSLVVSICSHNNQN